MNPHEEIPQSKYAQMKQNAAAYFTDYASALQATGHKYFGHAHNGTFDEAQFEKDFSTAFHEKHPVKNPVSSKLLIKSWNPKKETLIDYMNQMGISENVAPYVLEAQNYVVSTIDASKKSLSQEEMAQIVADIGKGMDKIESKVEQDKSLSDDEIMSVLIATTAAKSLTGAISEVVKDFLTNLELANSGNQVVLRCWLCRAARTWFNVVATIVVGIVTAVATTIRTYADIVGSLGDLSFDDFATVIDRFGGTFNNIFGPLGGNYTCYLPDDLWQCPQ